MIRHVTYDIRLSTKVDDKNMTSLSPQHLKEVVNRCIRYLPEIDTILNLNDSIKVFGGAIRFIVEQSLEGHDIDRKTMCEYVKRHDLDLRIPKKDFSKLKTLGYSLVEKEAQTTYDARFSVFEMEVEDLLSKDSYKYDIVVYSNMCYDFIVNSMDNDFISKECIDQIKAKELVVMTNTINHCTIDYAMKMVLRVYKMRALGYHHINVSHFQRNIINIIFRGVVNSYQVDGYCRDCIKHIIRLDPLYDEYISFYDIEALYNIFPRDISHIIFCYLTRPKVIDFLSGRGYFKGIPFRKFSSIVSK